jgi:hypothetical protein
MSEGLGMAPSIARMRNRQLRNLLIVPCVALAVLLLSLLWILPVSHSFSVRAGNELLFGRFNPPQGSTVAASWYSLDGSQVAIAVEDSHGIILYSSYATKGSFEFTAANPPYSIPVECAAGDWVQVDGAYSIPLL